jgi:hypothetical protein
MGLLENALRDTFAAQVSAPPVVDDAAGRAIRHAVRVRRRRSALGAAAVAAAMALTSAGVVAAGGSGSGWAPAAPAPAEPPETISAALPADVLSGNHIVLATGGSIALTGMPEAEAAWRVFGGWLVETSADSGRMAVWFVSERGNRRRLVEAAQVIVGGLRPGTPAVAWGEGGTASVARIVDGDLVDEHTTGGTGTYVPAGIVGGGVLLCSESGGTKTYDMWFPTDGPYRSGAIGTQLVIGTVGDSSRLLGLIGQRFTCLALINPVQLATVRSRCDLDLTSNDMVSSSPDGRYLLTVTSNGLDLYELQYVWGDPSPLANWPITPTSVAWLPDGSIVAVDGFRVIHLHLDNADRREVTEVVGGSDERLKAIPDLRL